MAEKHVYDGSASCGGCDTRWTAKTWCHCGACHATFSGLGYFDAHRVGGCHTPPAKDARLVGGVWRGPEFDANAVFAA